MPGGLVLVQDALVDHGVDQRLSGLESAGCAVLVAGFNGGRHLFHLSADFRTHRHVVQAALVVLTGAFGSLFRVCHERIP